MKLINSLNVLNVPDFRGGNPYQQLLADALAEKNVTVTFTNFPKSQFPLISLSNKHPHAKIIHINWITELIERAQWSRSSFRYWLKCFFVFIECIYLRCKGKRIVWTIHNKFAHEGLDKKRELLFRRMFFHGVNEIIVHSKEALAELEKLYGSSLRKKANVIFHGNYIDSYPMASLTPRELRCKLGISSQTLIGYVGVLRPYKGIEKLIEAFKQNTDDNKSLLIAGKPHNEQYRDELLSLCSEDKRIFTHFEFLSEQQLIDHIESCDFVCLPFSDTLTSGSVILAMSRRKPLILSDTARVFGCVPEEGAFYFSNQHDLEKLLATCEKFSPVQMGEINFKAALQMDWKIVAAKTISVYKNCKQ